MGPSCPEGDRFPGDGDGLDMRETITDFSFKAFRIPPGKEFPGRRGRPHPALRSTHA
ncbi:hypothetical protein GCM10025734_46380 [Kitasatospora paranensis]